MMLPIVVFALGLSVWQMERREWKLGILDRIAENQAAAPMTLDELIKGDPLRREYGRVRIAGTLLNDKEYYLAARSLKDDVGIQVITPLRTDDGTHRAVRPRLRPVGEEGSRATRAAGQPSGRVELTGIVRRNQVKRYFAPDNDPAKNFWFHVDVPLMRKDGGRQARSGARHLLPRSRCDAQSRRPADRRPDPARYPQRPPAVRHHLVPDRDGGRSASISPITGRTAGSP